MDKICIGIIGCGLASTWHIDYLRNDNRTQIVALTDPNKNSLQAALGRIPSDQRAAVAQYRNYTDMLKGSKMDAALVLTPHRLHYEHVSASLQQNLHVLVEKPLTVSAVQ